MNKKKRIKIISDYLNALFPHPSPTLKHKNPFTLLIAVVLSAHSTDRTVNKVTPILFKKAETAKKMSHLSQKKIQQMIRPCGLSLRKSRAILALSKILVKKFKGKVPKTFEDLEALPGVGHKTASVVLNQAFNIPTFPVDTHIFRLAKKWGLTKAKTKDKAEEDLKKSFPKKSWGKLHLQMIYYARKYCPARGHVLNKCPICLKLKHAP